MHNNKNQKQNCPEQIYVAIPLNAYQQKLITEIKSRVEHERHSTMAVLQLLRKIESEKIYAIMGYSSIWEFATKELAYSHDAAYRRIAAMRLVKKLPQAKEKIERGSLSLTAAAQLQTFIRAEEKVATCPTVPTKPLTDDRKLDILNLIDGL